MLPNRTWTSIKLRAAKLNIKRYFNQNRLSDVSVLLENTPTSYYWVGFLLADAHFTKNRLRVALSIKDQSHLQKFSRYVLNENSVKVNGDICSFSAMSALHIPILREKFEIDNNKTTIPSNIKVNNDDLFISLLIGFIDGDGHIVKLHKRKDFQIVIKLHSTWLNNLKYIQQRLSSLAAFSIPEPKVNKDGYAVLTICNTEISKYLKSKASDLKLPVLDRKWDIVDLNFLSRYRLCEERTNIIFRMVSEGFKNTDIAKHLNMSKSAITRIRQKHNK